LKEKVLNFQIPPVEPSLAYSRAAGSVESKMATMQHKKEVLALQFLTPDLLISHPATFSCGGS